jgi:molybdate transport system substrate-binding protein
MAWSVGLLAIALVGCGSGRSEQRGTGPLRVAGASDLVVVMEEIVARFEATSSAEVDFIPGSSGKLAAQIRQGAPFDVFLSASEAFVDDAIASGACLRETRARYARGRVVMWRRDGSPPATLAGLADPAYRIIAIAQPDHAPYGAAARQALEKAGVWQAVEPRIVHGSNIADTMQLAVTGNADVALVALSLVTRSSGRYTTIPEELHRPIDQALVVCRNGRRQELGRRFAAFMRTPAIADLLTRSGFSPP